VTEDVVVETPAATPKETPEVVAEVTEPVAVDAVAEVPVQDANTPETPAE